MVVTTPSYGWYAGLLVALIALSGRLAWLPVALAPGLWYLLRGDVDAPIWVGRVVFAAALALTLALAGSVGRAGREGHRRGVRLAGRVGPGERDLVARVVPADGTRQGVG